MIVEGMVLSTIVTSLSVVYQAYSKIKSNKERCKQLVDRCSLIVDRLQPILVANIDAPITLRVKDLEHAFKFTADTITKVGEQGYVVSLLRTEENAALIEDAQRALTELITTLSLETIIDVSAWQRENELAVRKEFTQVKSVIRRLDQSLHSELAGHGATLGQLFQIVQDMATRLGEPLSPNPLLNGPAPKLPIPEGQPRTRSWSSPVGVRPSISSILDEAPPSSTSTAGNANNKRRNRMSWSNRLRVSSPAPSASSGNEIRLETRQQLHSPLFAPSPLIQSHMAHQALPLSQSNDETLLEPELPDTPPPAYSDLSWEDELVAVYARRENVPSGPDAPAHSRTSTEAVRADDSPVPTPTSPGLFDFGKPLPDDGLLKVRQSLKRKDITNFAAMKTIGQFGKINTRILVEMWLLPKIKTFDMATPLDCFEPTQRDKLQLIKSRANTNKKDASPVQGNDVAQPEYNHVLLLCPREAKPIVVVVESKQLLPQQVVKAYIIDAIEAVTLVSVTESYKKSWLLIPYYPDMCVWKAKQYIQKHFGNVIVDSCSFAGQPSQLEDNSTLFENGVQAYNHNLSMKITPFS